MEKTIEQANAELQDVDSQTGEVWEDVPRNDGTWKPAEDGEVLLGMYEGFEETRTGKKLYMIANDDMEPVKVWGGTIMDSYFNGKTGVQIGERVKITFLGKKPLMNGNIQKINAETGEKMFFNDYKVQHTKGKHAASKLDDPDAGLAETMKQIEAEEKAEKEPIDPKNIPF